MALGNLRGSAVARVHGSQHNRLYRDPLGHGAMGAQRKCTTHPSKYRSRAAGCFACCCWLAGWAGWRSLLAAPPPPPPPSSPPLLFSPPHTHTKSTPSTNTQSTHTHKSHTAHKHTKHTQSTQSTHKAHTCTQHTKHAKHTKHTHEARRTKYKAQTVHARSTTAQSAPSTKHVGSAS